MDVKKLLATLLAGALLFGIAGAGTAAPDKDKKTAKKPAVTKSMTKVTAKKAGAKKMVKRAGAKKMTAKKGMKHAMTKKAGTKMTKPGATK